MSMRDRSGDAGFADVERVGRRPQRRRFALLLALLCLCAPLGCGVRGVRSNAVTQPSNSEAPVPWLGVTVQAVPDAVVRYYHLGKNGGAVVAAVDPSGPGARARLERGDLLLALDGVEVDGPGYLAAWTGEADAVTLKVLRGGSVGDLRVALKAGMEVAPAPETGAAPPPSSLPEPPKPQARPAEVAPGVVVSKDPAAQAARQTTRGSRGEESATPPVAPAESAAKKEPVASPEQRAFSLYSSGRFNEALDAYRELSEEHPEDAKAHSNVGAVLNQLGRWDEAAVALERAVALDPRFAEAHYNWGLALWNSGHLEAALRKYRAAGEAAPDLLVAHLAEADALLQLERPEEALVANRRALSVHKDSPDGTRQKGEILRALGRPADEEEAYREALRANPADPDLLLKLAISLDRGGRPAEALQTLDQLTESGSAGATVYHNRALVKLRLGDAAGALADAEAALQREPRFSAAKGVRAEALRAMGRTDEATIAWGEVFDEEPSDLKALRELEALALSVAGDPKEVQKIQKWLAAVDADPGPTDGTLGPKTKEALVRFQSREGLRATGMLNGVTLYRLTVRVKRAGSLGSD